jgi:hypothetical protein
MRDTDPQRKRAFIMKMAGSIAGGLASGPWPAGLIKDASDAERARQLMADVSVDIATRIYDSAQDIDVKLHPLGTPEQRLARIAHIMEHEATLRALSSAGEAIYHEATGLPYDRSKVPTSKHPWPVTEEDIAALRRARERVADLARSYASVNPDLAAFDAVLKKLGA